MRYCGDYRTRKRPVMMKEGGFWFVQDPVRHVPGTYLQPSTIHWANPIKVPEVKQLQHSPRLCGSWLSAYTVSRFLIARNWFRPNPQQAFKLALEMCGHGPIRPVVENAEIIGYDVRREARWVSSASCSGTMIWGGRRPIRLGGRHNIGFEFAKYVRYSTRRRAQIARGGYWLENKCQPARRFFLERMGRPA